MNGTWGSAIGLTLFGESHGQGVGITMSQLPAGVELDLEEIQRELDRRKPGTSDLVTPRKEADQFQLMSGFFQGKTTGAPLTAFIPNTNQRSRDYNKIKDVLRPGHADWTAHIKYDHHHDYRGGGHFSGRLTAGLVFAGAVAKQLLKRSHIQVGAAIQSIHKVSCEHIHTDWTKDDLLRVDFGKWSQSPFPVLDDQMAGPMKAAIEEAKAEHNSVGGVIRGFAVGLPAGLGRPFFDSLESQMAHLIFSIPAVKGLAFGEGFDLSRMKGSEANDEIYIEEGVIRSRTNHNGGILGGISNGMPLDLTVGIKPTPSIGLAQETINVARGETVHHQTDGRHDPCIVPRAVPVVEAAMALVVLDALLSESRV